MVFEDLVKECHAGQTRNNGKIPYFEHLKNTQRLLLASIKQTHEVNDNVLRRTMSYAALGHDLIEDTNITESQIEDATNEQVLGLIKELTNPDDDEHIEKYLTQIKKASGEARLIKYVDLIENTTSIIYGVPDLGVEWTTTFFLPILTSTTDILSGTSFASYPKTAKLLRNILAIETDILLDKLS